MKEIELTQGYVALVDDDDYERFGHMGWCVHADPRRPNLFYAKRGNTSGGKNNIWLHREIMGAERGQVVDHIDRNTLNNCKSNLRIVSSRINTLNCGLRSDNATGFAGVSYIKKRGKWQASIGYYGKNLWLGYFDDPTEAALAYDAAAIKLNGQYARLNFKKDAIAH